MGGAYDYTIQPEANIQKQSGGLVFYYVFRYRNDFTCTNFFLFIVLYFILFWLLFFVAAPTLLVLAFPFYFFDNWFFLQSRDRPYTTQTRTIFFLLPLDTHWNAILIVRQTIFFLARKIQCRYFDVAAVLFQFFLNVWFRLNQHDFWTDSQYKWCGCGFERIASFAHCFSLSLCFSPFHNNADFFPISSTKDTKPLQKGVCYSWHDHFHPYTMHNKTNIYIIATHTINRSLWIATILYMIRIRFGALLSLVPLRDLFTFAT